MDTNFQKMSRILKAVSDPKRLQIVHMLTKGELGASQILESFNITQPTLSHDMHVLLSSGLVSERRMGKHVLYSLEREAVEAFSSELAGMLRMKKR